MSNLKLNKPEENKNDFDVIPEVPTDIPTVDEAPKAAQDQGQAQTTIVKEQQEEGRKLFANKKANIALGVIAGVFVLSVLAALFYIYIY